MSSLGIFDKETKTYKKVADLSKPAVIDSSMSDTSTNAVQNKIVKSYVDTRTTVDTGMSDTSTNPVQNKAVKSYVDGRTTLDTSMSDTSTKAVQNKVVKSYVDRRTTFDTAMSDTSTNAVQNKVVKSYVDGRTALDTAMSDSSTKAVQNKVIKSYVDGTFRKKSLAVMNGDGKTPYCQLCTIKINQAYVNTPIEITVQERFRATLDRLTVLFASIDNNDPNLASFKVFGECSDWYISKRAASTWVIYGTKGDQWSYIKAVDCAGINGVNVTWDVTGVTSLPDSKTKAVWGGNVGHAVSADSASSASTASKLATPRNIALTGAVTGNANFDGSGNISIATSVNHTHNYAGSSSAGGAANLLYLPRVVKDANYQPGSNRIEAAEFSSSCSNLPSENVFHILTGQGEDPRYNTQLALSMTGGRMYYRNRNAGSWTSWKKIAYTSDYEHIQGEIDNLKKSVSDGKTTVANAITAKGVTTATDATFATMANNISRITTGVDTSDATATAGKILSGKTAYVKGRKITGSMPDNSGLNTNGSVPGINSACPDTPTRQGTALQFGISTDGIGRINICPPEGYYQSNGGSYVNRPASDFGNAAASEVLSGKTFTSSVGLAVPGTMANQGAVSQALNAGGSYTIPAGYHNGSGKITANSLASQTNATATAAQILSGQTAYVNGEKVTGTMPDNGAKTASLNCGGSYAIPAGYHNGSGKVTAKSLYSQTRATATAAQILSGQTAYVNGEKVTGKLGTKTTSFTRSTPTSLSTARNSLAGASVENYALFAGGYTGSSYVSTVDAYDSSLTRSTPTGLSTARNGLASASVGGYALFAGGYTGSNNSSTVDAYNSSLTRSTPTVLSTARNGLASANVKDYALFAGGFTGDSYSSKVDAYDSSLTRSTPTSLSTAKNGLAGANVGVYALFAGGYNDISYNSKVDAYNPSLTRSTPTSLSSNRRYLAGASLGNYALFAGGNTGSSSVSTVDAYNTSLTRSTPTELSTARNGLASTSVKGYALFAGGYTGNSSYSSTVDAYDSSLTRITPTELSTARNGLASARVKGYALFAGGTTSSRVSTVDAYEPPHVSIPAQKIYL